jgi:hypothetical protein
MGRTLRLLKKLATAAQRGCLYRLEPNLRIHQIHIDHGLILGFRHSTQLDSCSQITVFDRKSVSSCFCLQTISSKFIFQYTMLYFLNTDTLILPLHAWSDPTRSPEDRPRPQYFFTRMDKKPNRSRRWRGCELECCDVFDSLFNAMRWQQCPGGQCHNYSGTKVKNQTARGFRLPRAG